MSFVDVGWERSEGGISRQKDKVPLICAGSWTVGNPGIGASGSRVIGFKVMGKALSDNWNEETLSDGCEAEIT